MSQVNRYGLDFLKREHNVFDDVRSNLQQHASSAVAGERIGGNVPLEVLPAAVANKPDLEKQFDVIHFLQAHRSAGCLPPSVIFQECHIDLEEEINVAAMLQRNPKIRVETVPDPENPVLTIDTYAYQAKYNNVRDRKTLLAQINRCKNGVPMRDMIDSYDNVERDLDALITAGDIIALYNTEDKDKVLFPRGEPFLVELDGTINLPSERKKWGGDKGTYDNSTTTKNKSNGSASTSNNEDKKTTMTGSELATSSSLHSATILGGTSAKTTTPFPFPRPVYCVQTDSDPRTQIRRGEAVQIGGSWFRVSSAVKEGSLKDQPARATAPLSVVSKTDLSRRNLIDGYIRPFNEKMLPADAVFPSSTVENLRKAKEARERLSKLAHGGRAGGGGAVSQLLGVNAYASNPVVLAASLGSGHAAGGSRRLRGVGHHRVRHPTTTNVGGRAAAAHQQNETMELLKTAAQDPFLQLYSRMRRHGCTKDVREMYLNTRSKVPDSDADLRAALVGHKLLEPDEEMRRPRLKKRSNVDNDGKPKKRRYYERKNQRMTNTHLEGTEIGAVLRRATEKQQQGQAVGDGGM